jgi:hypothetical protein
MFEEAQKPSSGLIDDLNFEGLSVLTSEQNRSVMNYVRTVRPSYQRYRFDGQLYDAFQEVFSLNERVLKNMSLSIHDDHCTKSFYHVPETLEQFREFEASEPPNALWNVNVRAACAVLLNQIKVKELDRIELHHPEDLEKVWSNREAKAGFVNFGKTKNESVTESFITFVRLTSLIKRGVKDFGIPCQVFHRAQISGFINEDGDYSSESLKMKDRFVFGADAATVAKEGQYARPLIDHLARSWMGYAGGKSPEEIRSLIRRSANRSTYWLSIDYSKFDQTVPSWLLNWCFSVVKRFYPTEYESEIDWIAYNFVNTKVAIPGRGVVTKRKGIPSGSHFTQIIGSMANAIMAMSYIASLCPRGEFRHKVRYVEEVLCYGDSSELPMFVMGDDNLMFTSCRLDVDDLALYVHRVFGVRINPDKCDFGTRFQYPVFLKREWRGLGEYQDPSYLTINVIHPEGDRSYEGYSPWHIVYGLFLTYRLAFPSWMSERWLVEKMEENGGVSAIVRIPRSDLPGVFRAYGDDALRWMVLRAERLLKSVS